MIFEGCTRGEGTCCAEDFWGWGKGGSQGNAGRDSLDETVASSEHKTGLSVPHPAEEWYPPHFEYVLGRGRFRSRARRDD
eukprot:scaffold308_cov327-Pavlova_lutheri.AAC.12